MTRPSSVRVLTILARHGTDRYPDAEHQVDAIFRRRLTEAARRLVIVDNALPATTVHRQADRTVIGGDNRAREFSAFDKGLAFVGDEISTLDLVHFVTSAFHTLYVGYLERFSGPLLREAAGRAVCLGHIDCYNEPVEILGHEAQHWIRSGFFFLSPAQANALGTFAAIDEGGRFFSGDPRSPFRGDAPLSATYQRNILGWLTGRDIGQGVTWHSAFELNADTLSAFEGKALSMMNEQLLSIRLQQQGCSLIDVTWLSSMAAKGDLPSNWWTTPWREQLANRDRDRVVALH